MTYLFGTFLVCFSTFVNIRKNKTKKEQNKNHFVQTGALNHNSSEETWKTKTK